MRLNPVEGVSAIPTVIGVAWLAVNRVGMVKSVVGLNATIEGLVMLVVAAAVMLF